MTDNSRSGSVADPVFHREIAHVTFRPQVPLVTHIRSSPSILAVCSDGPDRAVWGTAFMVGPGIALTANHVIQEYRDAGRVPQDSMVLLGVSSEELHICGVR